MTVETYNIIKNDVVETKRCFTLAFPYFPTWVPIWVKCLRLRLRQENYICNILLVLAQNEILTKKYIQKFAQNCTNVCDVENLND